MSANRYSAMVAQLAAELTALASPSGWQDTQGYPELVVRTEILRPTKLPAFNRYCIVVSPNMTPWGEKRTAMLEVQDTYRVDLYLLVKNFDEQKSLFGTSFPEFGVFQLIQDVKVLLRQSDLNGLLAKTYDEPGGDPQRNGAGDVTIDEIAAPGFDVSEYTFVHRARIPYQAKMIPVCHPR